MIQTSDLIYLISDLVQINSINSWLISDGHGEAEIATYIENWLSPLNIEFYREFIADRQVNLVARLPGKGGGKSLCIYAHLDTVGCELWKERAFIPRVEGDRLYGLGSADDKGHCALALLVLKSIAMQSNELLNGDLWLALLADEEGTSNGVQQFIKKVKPKAAIILEPNALGNIVVTHQGFGWIDIIVKGKAAHGSAPELGIDSIAYMGEVITRLHHLDYQVFAQNPHPLNGKTVFHTSMIKGGTDYATYPAECILSIEIGTQPGETINDRIQNIETIFHEIRTKFPDFSAEVNVKLARDPFKSQGCELLWNILSDETNKILGELPNAVGENAWCDAALFQQAGIPTLMMGASGENFHAPDEWVSISELIKLGDILEGTIRRFCNE